MHGMLHSAVRCSRLLLSAIGYIMVWSGVVRCSLVCVAWYAGCCYGALRCVEWITRLVVHCDSVWLMWCPEAEWRAVTNYLLRCNGYNGTKISITKTKMQRDMICCRVVVEMRRDIL